MLAHAAYAVFIDVLALTVCECAEEVFESVEKYEYGLNWLEINLPNCKKKKTD